MSTIISGNQLRDIGLGRLATKSITQSGAGTQNVFTVTGGLVLVTSLIGRVTTAITVAGTTKLVANPTAGTSADLCTATDLGTTDTVAGEILVITKGASIALGADDLTGFPLAVETGVIEHTVATGGDGVIKWYCTWVPLDNGATLTAA
jgi:hypothetical protein